MKGKRVHSFKEVHDGEPGNYYLTAERDVLWIKLPTGSMGRLSVQEGTQGTEGPPPVWGFEEHEDETITVTPSIEQHEIPGNTPYWHGHLQRGEWIG